MRQVIILDTRKGGDGVTQVSGFHWFPITVATAKVTRPSFVSLGNLFAGAKALTAAEQLALEDGSVREEGFNISYSVSTTTAQIQADLQRRWIDRKAAIDAEPPTRQFYGLAWDGTTWA